MFSAWFWLEAATCIPAQKEACNDLELHAHFSQAWNSSPELKSSHQIISQMMRIWGKYNQVKQVSLNTIPLSVSTDISHRDVRTMRVFLTHTFGKLKTSLFLWMLLKCLEGDTGGYCCFLAFVMIMYPMNKLETSEYLNSQEVYVFSLEIC